MDDAIRPKLFPGIGQYDANYGNFQSELYAEIRHEAFGNDIGQNSWVTSDEQDRLIGWLGLSPGKILLDVACGAGGPALRLAAITGCSVVGIDLHDQAIAAANSLAAERGLAQLAEFRIANAATQSSFADASFDAITCIDAINHLPNRQAVIADWVRLLKPGGRLLFTDPIIVTGPLTTAEITVRSSSGFYLFVPPFFDERTIEECGLRLLLREDVTANLAKVAERRCAARASRSTALRGIEGNDNYTSQQEFLTVAACLAREGRLSRFVYISEKPA